ncbi:methionyl-tRNA formyltransferase [Streptomyces profundus]|uniref:methionyl-tRNA formyltransferase n=1 Tax=Streptomyces profundus TaxID=2867410 RepID=UPI001D16974E|nr:formyltransferase family protein [Streptomyces sp. MA3_2.13]UED86593.1 methionyl-tRNA formyltransferase [Streptomyces sp. MA3_2.13]
MSEQLRIGVISSGPDEFATIHAACVDKGHLPVVYLYGRSLRSGGPNLDDAGATTTAILDALPQGMDLLLPGTMDGLARSLRSHRVDLLVVFGFAWKLPPSVLEIPRLGVLNIHVAMLPRYRGPAPLLWAIRNGDATGGVTVHWMDEEFDTGNILAQQGGILLADDITWQNYCVSALPVVRRLLGESLDLAVAGDPGRPQDDAEGSYAGFMEPEFAVVDWSHSARAIHHQVRTHRYMRSSHHPVAMLDGGWRRVVRTSLSPSEGVLVRCGDGSPLWIVESEPAPAPE